MTIKQFENELKKVWKKDVRVEEAGMGFGVWIKGESHKYIDELSQEHLERINKKIIRKKEEKMNNKEIKRMTQAKLWKLFDEERVITLGKNFVVSWDREHSVMLGEQVNFLEVQNGYRTTIFYDHMIKEAVRFINKILKMRRG